MSARQALNKIRVRAGIGELPDGVDFREAYRRERGVELMFEGHRWYDIRRWMIAEDLFKVNIRSWVSKQLRSTILIRPTS